MIRISRQQFKKDPVWNRLFEYIKSNHRVADHTERTLKKNKHIKDFCEEAQHFVEMKKLNAASIYLSYDITTWWKEPNGIKATFEEIQIYDNKDEYETARRKGLNSTIHADGANLN